MEEVINKSDVIRKVAEQCDTITDLKAEAAVRSIIELLSHSLAQNDRIEIRGFGTFCLAHRESRWGRNPKTGERVFVPCKAIPHFKPGKALREGVNNKAILKHKV